MKQRRVTMRACPWSGSDCSISSIWPTVAAHRPSASFSESILVSACLIKLRTGSWLAAATETARAIADGGFFCFDPFLAAIVSGTHQLVPAVYTNWSDLIKWAGIGKGGLLKCESSQWGGRGQVGAAMYNCPLTMGDGRVDQVFSNQAGHLSNNIKLACNDSKGCQWANLPFPLLKLRPTRINWSQEQKPGQLLWTLIQKYLMCSSKIVFFEWWWKFIEELTQFIWAVSDYFQPPPSLVDDCVISSASCYTW